MKTSTNADVFKKLIEESKLWKFRGFFGIIAKLWLAFLSVMESESKRKFRRRVYIRLSGDREAELQRFLPEQEGVESKARYLLSVMVEVALAETEFRLVPKPSPSGRLHMVRLPDETYLAVKRYAEEGGLDLTKQASNLLVVGLELLEKSGSAGLPLGKEALVRRLRRALEKGSRLNDVWQGFRLIWRALTRR